MVSKIPQDFIDDLLTRINIVDIIDARIPLKKSGQNFKARCPFHDEKTPSFTVSPNKQIYHCFGCGVHGTAISFLMEYDRLNFIEALEELSHHCGLNLPTHSNHATTQKNYKKINDIFALLEQVSQYFSHQLRTHPEAGKALDFLKRRHISNDIASEFELGFAPPGWKNLQTHFHHITDISTKLEQAGLLITKESQSTYDRFRDRIIFPIKDKRGRTVGFGGRVFGQELPKYLNSPETETFHKSQMLYGLYHAYTTSRQLARIVVVEGYMDVIALAQHDIRYAVATLGTAVTEQHLRELMRHTQEIIFCFDGDPAGRKAAWRALETALPMIHDGMGIKFLFLPDNEDPDSLIQKIGKTAFEQQCLSASTFSAFFFETLAKNVDLRQIDGQAKLIHLTKPLLQKLQNHTYRNLILTRLAEYCQLPLQQLHAQFSTKTTKFNQVKSLKPGYLPPQKMASPIRMAIALLVEKPDMSLLVDNPKRFSELKVPGIQLLQDVLDFLTHKPQVTTAVLLEHWRNKPEETYLIQLAHWQHCVPTDGIVSEFNDAIKRIDQLLIEQKTERLIQKARQTTLNHEEKQMLKRLIQATHNHPTRSLE